MTREATAQILDDGNKAFESGDTRQAEEHWSKIRECVLGDADWPKAVFNLGLLEYNRKNFDTSVRYFNEVLQSHPDDKEAGGNLMETNRNYSHRSALAISECYEAQGRYFQALHYARLAKTRYPYYSWCGNCLDGEATYLNRRIAYLYIRASRAHIWGGMLVIGMVGWGWKRRKRKQPRMGTRNQ